MESKVTIKIDREVHKQLSLVKAHMQAKTFDDVLRDVLQRHMEMMQSRRK